MKKPIQICHFFILVTFSPFFSMRIKDYVHYIDLKIKKQFFQKWLYNFYLSQ